MRFRICNSPLKNRRSPAGMKTFGLLGLVMLLVSACQTGRQVDRAGLPAQAPRAADVLRDLTENDNRILNFRSGGTFTLVSPDLEGVKRFRGSVRFRRPADLYVQGNHRLTNIPVFKLTAADTEFVMEFPNSREHSFYRIEGERYENVPFSVSPPDIAREMFLPEPWSELGRREARIVAYDTDTGVATMEIGKEDRVRRVMRVVRVVPETPRWVVVHNLLLGDAGRILAQTRLEEYSTLDGALFPAYIDAWFPTESTRMTFELRNIRLNTDIPDHYFNVRERAEELNLAAVPVAHKAYVHE